MFISVNNGDTSSEMFKIEDVLYAILVLVLITFYTPQPTLYDGIFTCATFSKYVLTCIINIHFC
jgi:hypothetical protein